MKASQKKHVPQEVDLHLLGRIAAEGYGPGAWHGPDLKAALSDVPAKDAFWRPSKGRHSIAEIALHHAYCVRGVRGQISGKTLEPFVLEGEDWFPLDNPKVLSWAKILEVMEAEHDRLSKAIADARAGRLQLQPAPEELLQLVLGVTCHAVYHAGQVQLLKRLAAG